MTKATKGTLQTCFGDLEYTLTDADHVFLHGVVTVNRVKYNLNAHLYDNGVWWCVRERRPISAFRVDNHRPLTIPAWRTLREELPKAWADFVTDDMVKAAALKSAIEERDRALTILEEARSAYRAADKTYDLACERVTELNQ